MDGDVGESSRFFLFTVHKAVVRAEDEEEDGLSLVTVPLKLKLGMNLCIRLWFSP